MGVSLKRFPGIFRFRNVKCIRSRVQLKRDGTRWRTGGEVKGKLANGVGSQHPSQYLGTCVSSITTADVYTSAASSRRPCRIKWTRSFRRKTKSGVCACAITFQTQSTPQLLLRQWKSRKSNIRSRSELAVLCLHGVCYINSRHVLGTSIGTQRHTGTPRCQSTCTTIFWI